MTDSVRPDKSSLNEGVDRYLWHHTLDVGDGVVTRGMFDHRPMLDRYPTPADLSGQRCLDVGTLDGDWACRMERRGAAPVTALDNWRGLRGVARAYV